MDYGMVTAPPRNLKRMRLALLEPERWAGLTADNTGHGRALPAFKQAHLGP